MLKDDYIVRLVEQLADFMRRLLATLMDGPGRVEAEADEALRALAGLDLATVRALPLAALLVLLRRGGEVEPGRALVVAEVLAVQASADAAMGLDQRARVEKGRAAALYLEALLRLGEGAPVESVARAEALLGEVAEEPLSAEVAARLVMYREGQGRFAEAEDALFELLRADPARAAEIGVPFFRRLQFLSDDDLVAGGLPRDEVEQGLVELQTAAGGEQGKA